MGMGQHSNQFQFDFALSFAGEDRAVAEQLANMLGERGASVFYDRSYQSHLLGKRLGKEFARVYGPATRFFVPIISEHYARKDYTNYEWTIAKSEEQQRNYEFILPLIVDDTPLIGLHADVAFIDLRREPLKSVVDLLMEKLRHTGPMPATHAIVTWVATFGLNIEELLDEWELPDSVPRYYPSLCDWLEKDLERRLQHGRVKKFRIIEDHRTGETLSVRIIFQWSPSNEPLDFGHLDWWEVLEVVPAEEVYPGEEALL